MLNKLLQVWLSYFVKNALCESLIKVAAAKNKEPIQLLLWCSGLGYRELTSINELQFVEIQLQMQEVDSLDLKPFVEFGVDRCSADFPDEWLPRIQDQATREYVAQLRQVHPKLARFFVENVQEAGKPLISKML